jgi:hypothetical protein
MSKKIAIDAINLKMEKELRIQNIAWVIMRNILQK